MTKQLLDESWQRYPEARIRMREGGLKHLLEGLEEGGYCSASTTRINFIEDEGVYVEIALNVGKHGSIVALALEAFIPAKMPPVKKKKAAKKKKTNEIKTPDDTPIELHDDSLIEVGSTSDDDRVQKLSDVDD